MKAKALRTAVRYVFWTSVFFIVVATPQIIAHALNAPVTL